MRSSSTRITRKGTITIPETEHLLCEYCKKAKYLDQEDFTFCEICGAPVVSRHRPPYRICHECAQRENRCEQCSEKLDF